MATTLSSTSKKILDAYNRYKANVTPKTNPPPTSAQLLKSQTLGAATIAAQQKLSEQFAIPTFNIQGGISTLPTTGLINTKINVGTGAFEKEAFDNAVREFNANVLRFGPSGGSGGVTLQPNPQGTTTPGTSKPILESLKEGFRAIPPIALIGAVGLGALLLLKK